MAVLAVWQCDRDGAMFQDKKEAEEYDRMLELAENISVLVEQIVPDLQAQKSEAIGLFLAKNREVLAKACKGKPELLSELNGAAVELESAADASAVESAVEPEVKQEVKKVTPIKAKA